jgi:hypothetical protein
MESNWIVNIIVFTTRNFTLTNIVYNMRLHIITSILFQSFSPAFLLGWEVICCILTYFS